MLNELKVLSVKHSFDNIKYRSYPRNADFEDLKIESKQRFFTLLTIYCLTNNKVERLKVISKKYF